MKQKKKYTYGRKQKKNISALTISLIISGVIMTSLVIWLGMHQWDIEKGFPALAGKEEQKPVTAPENNEEADDAKIEDPEQPTNEPSDDSPEQPVGQKEPVQLDPGGYIEGQQLPDEPTYVKGVLIASKKYPLPSTFAPGENKEAREAFEQLAAEAKLVGFHLHAFSTYRSFEYQTTLYDRYVARDGKEAADRYSARPGYSEHQTGLAFDIGEVNYEQHWASSSFGDTEAGKWLAENAHRFGFIMRYPSGKEQITGYMHESWHFRYVGEEIAKKIYEKGITLEEYLGL